MPRNRVASETAIRLPRPAEPPITPTTFVAFPAAAVPGMTPALQQLYQCALEQALAAARPSLPERDLAGVWN